MFRQIFGIIVFVSAMCWSSWGHTEEPDESIVLPEVEVRATHNPVFGYETDRAITLEDGRIVKDEDLRNGAALPGAVGPKPKPKPVPARM